MVGLAPTANQLSGCPQFTCTTCKVAHIKKAYGSCLRIVKPCRRLGCVRQPSPHVTASSSGEEEAEPDWDAEMSIFKQRITKPNQLSTLRKLLERTDVGKVLFAEDALAIVEGLVNDAPVGTELQFASGSKGVLLWRRSDNICFVLVLDSEQQPVAVGEQVECTVKGILQVVDEDGPQTKREFAAFNVPVGPHMVGKVVDFQGRPWPAGQSSTSHSKGSNMYVNGGAHHSASSGATGAGQSSTAALDMSSTDVKKLLANAAAVRELPLFNEQLDMSKRQQICEALTTQVMAFDTLTPMGRGQALLLTGAPNSGQTELVTDAILGQQGSDVRCVYALVGHSVEQTQRTLQVLEQYGAMAYSTVVVSTSEAPLGEQYAALAAACSLGEYTRDAGGHSLVVLDDVAVMPRLWERIAAALADLGLKAMELNEGDSAQVEEGGEEALVEYEGMLVSAAAAQRRRFFSSLIQRAAKADKRLGSGSMTLLMVMLGNPATGQVKQAAEAIKKYKHLSEEQKAKLLAAVNAKHSDSSSDDEGVASGSGNAVRTEVIEEWMSITDGQVVQRRQSSSGTSCIDPQLSVSRIGARAYHPAAERLAPAVRLELAQAADAQRFSGTASATMQRALARAARTSAALEYSPRELTPYEVQVVMLYALQRGFVEQCEPGEVKEALQQLVASLKQTRPQVLQHIASSKDLSEEDEEELERMLDVLSTLLKTKGLQETQLLQS